MRSSIASVSRSVAQMLLIYIIVCICLTTSPTRAIKFDIEAKPQGQVKCIWNYALSDTLVIVTVNPQKSDQSAHGQPDDQIIDVEVVDGSKHNNIYLSKRNLKAETRMAINTHSHADLGVCISNRARKGELHP